MDRIVEFLANPQTSRQVKLLAILEHSGGGPLRVREIQNHAVVAGFREAKKWNVSDVLKNSGGANLLPEGWKLAKAGRDILSKAGWNSILPDIQNIASDLNDAAAKVKDADRRAFVLEALSCYANENYRAAVVLSWTGAIAVLHAYVFDSQLVAFNAEAKQRGLIKKDIKIEGELGELKEFDFLQVIKAVGVVDKNQKQDLEERLKFRNSCGHPNKLRIRNRMAAAHLESLIINVFEKF